MDLAGAVRLRKTAAGHETDGARALLLSTSVRVRPVAGSAARTRTVDARLQRSHVAVVAADVAAAQNSPVGFTCANGTRTLLSLSLRSHEQRGRGRSARGAGAGEHCTGCDGRGHAPLGRGRRQCA